MANGFQGLFGGFQDPRTQGLLGLASGLLQAGGPSMRPISLGQALGGGIQQGLGAFNVAQQRQLQNRIVQQQLEERQRQREAITGLQQRIPGLFGETPRAQLLSDVLGVSPQAGVGLIGQAAFPKPQDPSNLIKTLRGAGIDPTTPEGQRLVRDVLLRPSTQIRIGEKAEEAGRIEFAKQKAKIDVEVIKKGRDEASNLLDITERLGVLLPRVPTGALQPGVIKVKRGARGVLDLVGIDTTKLQGLNTADQEEFTSVARKLIAVVKREVNDPRMNRDELRLYKSIIPEIGKSPETNRRLIEMANRTQRRAILKAQAMEKWMADPRRGNGTLRGFTAAWLDWISKNPIFVGIDLPTTGAP